MGVDASASVLAVRSVLARGLPGHIGRCIRYHAGTTGDLSLPGQLTVRGLGDHQRGDCPSGELAHDRDPEPDEKHEQPHRERKESAVPESAQCLHRAELEVVGRVG